MMVLAITVLVTFAGGLYFIVHNNPAKTQQTTGMHPQMGGGLPPKPEERWSYIKELENRQISPTRPIESSNSNGINSSTQLTDEQRQLLEQMQADMRQAPTTLAGVPANTRVEMPRTTVLDATPQPVQQNIPSNKESSTSIVKKPTENVHKTEKKSEQKISQRWILQCGSFRSIDQAESIRAQLAFSGIESRITAEGGWNRVVLGPYTSRTNTDKMLQRLRNAGTSSCIVVDM